MTKERIEKELLKVREQLAGLQARQKDLEEQLQMAEDAEKMKFIEKNKISLERLILLNKVSEEEILHLLKKKEQEEQTQQSEKEAVSHEKNEPIILGSVIAFFISGFILYARFGICHERELCSECSCGGYRAGK